MSEKIDKPKVGIMAQLFGRRAVLEAELGGDPFYRPELWQKRKISPLGCVVLLVVAFGLLGGLIFGGRAAFNWWKANRNQSALPYPNISVEMPPPTWAIKPKFTQCPLGDTVCFLVGQGA
jgi:hypothetical protein